MLYCAPVVLKNILSFNKYLHFISLHIAIRILINANLYTKYLEYAHSLLKYFVKQFKVIYGAEYISHNVHGLIHVVDDCRIFGPLDLYSAFPYENYLQYLKRLVRKSHDPLAQLVNHIHELQNMLIIKPLKKNKIENDIRTIDEDPLPMEHLSAQFKKLIVNNMSFSTRFEHNCCYLKDKSIMLIENFAIKDNKYYLIGKKFINVISVIFEPF